MLIFIVIFITYTMIVIFRIVSGVFMYVFHCPHSAQHWKFNGLD